MHCLSPMASGGTPDFASSSLNRKLCLSFKGLGRVRAALTSGEGDLLSYPNGNGVVGQDTLFSKQVNQSTGIEIQPDAASFGTLAAEITPTTSSFFVDNDEYDLDRPTEGFASIMEAIEDIHQGKVSLMSRSSKDPIPG